MVTAKTQLTVNTAGTIVSFNVPEDIYMRDYAEHFCEWVDGTVIKMSPIHIKHDSITQYLIVVFNTYFELRPVGQLCSAPFVMSYEFVQEGEIKQRNREPDLQIILDSNTNTLMDTYMDGAADIVIEVVSSESIARDYGEKLHEYEQAGVPEYWIIDPLKNECRFYLLNAANAYVLQEVEDNYESPRLQGLKLHIPTLWQDNLPGPMAVAKAVLAMAGD